MKDLFAFSILMVVLSSCNTKTNNIDIEKEKEIAVTEALEKIENDRQKKLDVIDKYYGAVLTGDFSVYFEVLAENYTIYPSDPGQQPGVDEVIQHMKMYGTMFSDMSVINTHILVDKDLLQVRGEWTMTHTGEAFGVPKTGKQIKMVAFDLHHFNSEGKIDKTWHLEDYWGAYAQMTAE